MSLAQAAAELNVTRAVVWRHVKAGDIAAQRIGRIYVIPVDELERYKRARRPPGRPRTRPAP